MNAVRFLVTCPLCRGRRTVGTAAPQTCPECAGIGGHLREPGELTPEQATQARLALAEAPADAEAGYYAESTTANIKAALAQRWVESVETPEGDPVHIDLVNTRGNAWRIFPEFHEGKFRNLNAIALPPVTRKQ